MSWIYGINRRSARPEIISWRYPTLILIKNFTVCRIRFDQRSQNMGHLGISSRVTLAGTSLSSATQYANTLSVGDQLKSRIPGIFTLFFSSKPNDWKWKLTIKPPHPSPYTQFQPQQKGCYVRSQVLTAMLMIHVFCDVMPCLLVKLTSVQDLSKWQWRQQACPNRWQLFIHYQDITSHKTWMLNMGVKSSV